MNFNPNWKARCERRQFEDSIAIFLFQDMVDGKRQVVTDLVVTIYDRGEILPVTPITLRYETAQKLMDELWNCGLRPSEGSGSAGALLATQDHLRDMQDLTKRLLSLVENPLQLIKKEMGEIHP